MQSLSMQSLSLKTFSLDLFLKTSSLSGDENILESPWGVYSALSLTVPAANGQTQHQLLEALQMKAALDQEKFNGNDEQLHEKLGKILRYPMKLCKSSKYSTISMANGLFIGKDDYNSVKKTYLKVLSKYYKSVVTKVPFVGDSKSAVYRMNRWVEKQTKNKIKILMKKETISPSTRLVLVNAVYFRGHWLNSFHKSNIVWAEFYGSNFSKTKVPMMIHLGNYLLKDLPNLDAKIIWIPFKEGNFLFSLILPNKRDGIVDLKDKLSKSNDEVKSQLFQPVESKTWLELKIPGMRLQTQVNMKSVLQNQMNIRDLFDKEKVDLSGMSDHRDLIVDEVIHKAFFEVDEDDSEATIAPEEISGLIYYAPPIQPHPIKFHADHPFILAICDSEEGVPLFLGLVNNI